MSERPEVHAVPNAELFRDPEDYEEAVSILELLHEGADIEGGYDGCHVEYSVPVRLNLIEKFIPLTDDHYSYRVHDDFDPYSMRGYEDYESLDIDETGPDGAEYPDDYGYL